MRRYPRLKVDPEHSEEVNNIIKQIVDDAIDKAVESDECPTEDLKIIIWRFFIKASMYHYTDDKYKMMLKIEVYERIDYKDYKQLYMYKINSLLERRKRKIEELELI